LSNGKPKARDQSSTKFLQRIAGKKALAPPPTPRPVIGEHPVRTLLRENDDVAEVERPAAERPAVREESSAAGGEAPPPFEQVVPAALRDVKPLRPGVDTAERVTTPKVAAQPAAAEAKTKDESAAPAPSDAEESIRGIKNKYRLNRGEFALYRELYLMTHAVGKAECSFVVSELVKATGMLERRVRDNLRRLKKNGWLVQLEAYDFEHREKAKYRVNVEPGF
jgi:hypothetical protein